MKKIYQTTLQALLDAAAGGYSQASASEGAPAARHGVLPGASRTLVTKLGSLTLRVPAAASDDFVSEFFLRYQMNEMKILLLIGRILVRGRAVPATVSDLAGMLCAGFLDAAQIGEIAARINAGLPAYFEWEQEHIYHQRMAMHDARPAREPAYVYASCSSHAKSWRREA